MSYYQPEQDISLSREEDGPLIAPMSSRTLDEQGEESQRLSSISPHLSYSQLSHDSQHQNTMQTTQQGGASNNSSPSQGTSSRHSEAYNNPLRLSHQSSQFNIQRVPVPEREVSVASPSPVNDLRNTPMSEMSSPGDTLIGGYSPRRSSRWGHIWSFSDLLHRKKSSSDALTMDMQPIAGTDCPLIMEEAACDGNSQGACHPKHCCENSPELCSSKKDIQSSSCWQTIAIIILSLYSTVMSAVWLILAIKQPRWGRRISSSSGVIAIAPNGASLLTVSLAKTIELSFVTIFITFLGQIITRKAISRGSRGTTLAEMSMPSWLIQPGSLVTHSGMLRYAGWSVLGVLSLLATLVATLYTTASNAMVTPKLMHGDWEHKAMSGYIRSSYANIKYVQALCPNMLAGNDEGNTGACTEVILSGESYRNLKTFMSVWKDISFNGTSKTQHIRDRPAGIATLNGTTTLYGSWIETEHSNVTAHFEKTGRIINNVTMAMPHPGVAAAATSPLNGILQPGDLNGVGEYAVKAGVVSPVVNVMCVNMAPDELKPLVYTEWPYAKTNMTNHGLQKIGWLNWTQDVPNGNDGPGEKNYLNRTAVDDIFRWGPTYNRRPPVFQMFPADYNMVVNSTVKESDAIYIMAKNHALLDYTLCELRSWVSPNCSTQFNISGITGSKMAAHCEDPDDINSYRRSYADPPEWGVPVADWKWLADQWRTATDLNGGLRNNNAANARILTQLILQAPRLLPYVPSLAEALAVFASSTLVLGAVGTPFRHYWEYETPGSILGEPGIAHQFNASVMTQQYTSSHEHNWQRGFYVILALMFALNLLCVVYICSHRSLVTDYTVALNLFSLALNSAPSEKLKGTCGGGPHGRDLAVPWRVGYASDANHYFIEQTGQGPRKKSDDDPNGTETALGRNYDRLRNKNPWFG